MGVAFAECALPPNWGFCLCLRN